MELRQQVAAEVFARPPSSSRLLSAQCWRLGSEVRTPVTEKLHWRAELGVDSCQGRPVFVEFFTKVLCFELARSSCCTFWRHQDLLLKCSSVLMAGPSVLPSHRGDFRALRPSYPEMFSSCCENVIFGNSEPMNAYDNYHGSLCHDYHLYR